MKRLRLLCALACFLITALITMTSVTVAQGAPHWLNGTWSGEAPKGGVLELTLTVVGEKVEGKATVLVMPPIRGKVSGKVSEKTVTLDVEWGNNTSHYTFTLADNGALVGKAGKRGGGKDLYFEKKEEAAPVKVVPPAQ